MINLYARNETNFNNNGQATLTPMSCLFTAQINGIWKLDLELAYDSDKKYALIDKDKLLKVDKIDCINSNYYGQNQLFRIYDFKKNDSSMTVTAYPVGMDARFDTYTDKLDLSNKTASSAISSINGLSNKYTVTTNVTASQKAGTNAVYENQNIISILNGDNGFVKNWGGEIVYDNYNIKVRDNLGTSSKGDIRYGKNLSSMFFEEDTSNTVTRIYTKSKNGDVLNGISQYKIANNPYVDSPKIGNYTPNPRIYYVQAPNTLTQEKNDGSETYTRTISAYNTIASLARDIIEEKIYSTYSTNFETNLNLDYFRWLYNKTTEKDGFAGTVEKYCNTLFSTASVEEGHTVLSNEFKDFARKAVLAGFKEAWDGWTSGYEWRTTLGGDGYYPKEATFEPYYYRGAWVKKGSKWCYIPADGGHTSSNREDSSEWKFYIPSGVAYVGTPPKRYGNKSKDDYYLKNEMYKIDDVWYWFDEDGFRHSGKDMRDGRSGDQYTQFGNYFTQIETTDDERMVELLVSIEKDLFNLLYTNMTTYVSNMYSSDHLDEPTVNIAVNLVDIKNTTEYQNFSDLLTLHLGDIVACHNYKTGIHTEERIVSLVYDVLRGYNTQVEIGVASNSVLNILSEIGSNAGTKFVAGNGIQIENNVISVVPNNVVTGVQDVQVDGVSKVDGHIAYLNSDDFGGLEYWVETPDSFYLDGSIPRLNGDYVYDYKEFWFGINPDTPGYFFRKPEVEESQNAIVGEIGYAMTKGFVIMSPKQEDVAWEWAERRYSYDTGTYIKVGDWMQPNTHPYNNYSWVDDYIRSGSVEIDGNTWYISVFTLYNGFSSSTTNYGDIDQINETSPIGTSLATIAQSVLDSVTITNTVPTLTEIGEDGYAFRFANGTKANPETDIAYVDTYGNAFLKGNAFIEGDASSDEWEIDKEGNGTFHHVITDRGDVDENLDLKQDKLTAGDNINIDANNVISSTISDFVGATANDDGVAGLVPKPLSADREKFLKGDGTWAEASGGGGSSDLDAVELTKAQYDALTPEEKADEDKIYFVKDYNPAESSFPLQSEWTRKQLTQTVDDISLNSGDYYSHYVSFNKTNDMQGKMVIIQGAFAYGYDSNDNPYEIDALIKDYIWRGNEIAPFFRTLNTSSATIIKIEYTLTVIYVK